VNSKEIFRNINDWNDFISHLETLNKKEKGDAFELLSKLYFKLSPKYNFYDEVWMLCDVPISVLEELGLPGHDLGIDLIAKSGTEYHAIQCKYHSDKNQSVTFKEVSTFISLLESNKKFTQGYICSTADLTSRNYNKLNTKPINLILSDSWQELGKEFFENARQFLSKKKVSLVPFKPRDHQKKALSDAAEYFNQEENTRGKLIFPCGAGKSLTGFWMINELKSKSTLIAVPSLSLVKQTLDVYLREIVAQKRKIKWLCICSDEGIGQGDDVVFFTENLGVPCQTDPAYIEQWLKTNIKEEIIVFTTYQSGRLIADISKKLNYAFDLGIFDEAHKTVGSDKKLFSHLLFEENISIAKRIFMTATERFYRGSKDDIISMDNYEIYGDTFTQMSFKEAIDLGLLTDYKVITIDVKKSEIAEFIKENNLVQLNEKWGKETEARSLASMLALRKAMKKFPIKNAVSFHSSIDKAIRNKELQNYITDTYHYDPIESYTVSGKLPTSKRNVIVQEFARSPKSLITNARCLTEGVDVPNIDCIVFSDPRKSKVDIVQAMGRALRKKEGKDWGYVVLPVIYDEETQEIDNENFEEILSIVRGLASNDERIVEYFKEKNDPKGSKTKSPGQFQLDVFSEYIDEAELSDQLEIRLWEKLARLSYMSFEEARNFVRTIGLKSYTEWRHFSKTKEKPSNIPSNPRDVYEEKGWKSWGDWLGTDVIATKYIEFISFNEAREYAQSLRLKNVNEWWRLTKINRPSNIPSTPQLAYENNGWNGWDDFLGLKNYRGAKINWMPFEEARAIIRNLGLKNATEWHEYSRTDNLDKRIPRAPAVAYRDIGWISIGDWIGTDRIADQFREYLSFEEARKFMVLKKISNYPAWREYRFKNNIQNIPFKLERTYSKDWKGAKHFFSTEIPTYEQAKEIIQKYKLKSSREYFKFVKNNIDSLNLPGVPYRFYKNSGWTDWQDFLGYEEVKRTAARKTYASFSEAKKLIKDLGIQTSSEYLSKVRDSAFREKFKLSTHPERIYNSEWKGWDDFLEKK
jgi:superfamily II DNA or RNA helicase